MPEKFNLDLPITSHIISNLFSDISDLYSYFETKLLNSCSEIKFSMLRFYNDFVLENKELALSQITNILTGFIPLFQAMTSSIEYPILNTSHLIVIIIIKIRTLFD